VLRQALAALSEVTAVDPGFDLDSAISACRAQLQLAARTLEQPLALPGPTGESNTLHLEPRGALLMPIDQASQGHEYLMALVSALVGGNAAVVLFTEDQETLWRRVADALRDAGLPGDALTLGPLEQLSSLLDAPLLAGTLVHSHSAFRQSIGRALARRDGPILPLVSAVEPDLLLHRTLLEKTISIDTTAAGGNASLMTLSI
jgi:RHH-type proline utilization regulon transcriptional repressor/proline dehydrogenase/delta 1-pyrroline-5-carboxylate dehydrogenase